MSVPPAAFHRLKIEYALGTAVPVGVGGIALSDAALVTVNVFYRARRQSVPVPANAPIVMLPPPAGTPVPPAPASTPSSATGPWSAFKYGFTFQPSVVGIYTVTLTGLTLAGASISSLITVQLEAVCIVKF